MPQIVRFGCAGVAVIIIAALTSVGLYAVLTGGLPFGGPAPKPITGGAQVLVTIQAGQPTPTPPSASTPTPAGGAAGATAGSSASVLAAPVATALAPPPPTAAPTPTATVTPAQMPGPGPGGPAASPAASPAGDGSSTVSSSQVQGAAQGQGAAQPATHDGLAAEIVEVERGWQPTDAAGTPIPVRDGHELVTVQIRLVNGAAEARYVSENDLVLVSDDGARFAPKQTIPQREPRLLTMPLLPGDTVRGWLTFETPSGQVTRRVQWSPTRPDRPRAETAFNLSLPR